MLFEFFFADCSTIDALFKFFFADFSTIDANLFFVTLSQQYLKQ